MITTNATMSYGTAATTTNAAILYGAATTTTMAIYGDLLRYSI